MRVFVKVYAALVLFANIVSSRNGHTNDFGKNIETSCPQLKDIQNAITTLFNENDDSLWSGLTSDISYRACWQNSMDCHDKQGELEIYQFFIPLLSNWNIQYKSIRIGPNFVSANWRETLITTIQNGKCKYFLNGLAIFYCDDDGKITERHEIWDEEQFQIALAGSTNPDGCK